jgi:hypothetical protein
MAKHARPAALAVSLLLAGLGLPSTAPAAKLKPITGKLSKRNYTVIALAANGLAKSDRAPRGKFKLRSPAEKVTLHLRSPNGAYAGPIVVGKRKKGKRALVGVRAGAKLGKVKLGKGYAKLKKRLAKKWLDANRTATAKKGVPIGAGNFGRVRVKRLKGPGADVDLDGVPAPLDIDDDGDLILDGIDGKTGRAGARAAQVEGAKFYAFTTLYELASGPINANAAGVSDAAIDASLAANGVLQLIANAPGNPFIAAEVDCRGLIYCSPGGSGTFDAEPDPRSPGGVQPFPECCDPDQDGLGSLAGQAPDSTAPPGGPGLTMVPGATTDQIRAGDLLIAQAECRTPCGPGGSRKAELTATLPYVLATHPALASYTDELGVTHAVSYPRGRVVPIVTPADQLPVVDGPDPGSDISARLTFWRPQRRAIKAEEEQTGSRWIDMGGLLHYANAHGGSAAQRDCPTSSYSDPDPVLRPSDAEFAPGSPHLFIDTADDQAADPSNTFSYTLNISQCLALRGAPGSLSEVGQSEQIFFTSILTQGAGEVSSFANSTYSFVNQP